MFRKLMFVFLLLISFFAQANTESYPVHLNQALKNDPDASSQNACVKEFLEKSISAKESYLADYSFTKDSLDHLPVYSLGKMILPAEVLHRKKLKFETSWKKLFGKAVNIIGLSPEEIIFKTSYEDEDYMEAKLKLIAWGDFNHDGVEALLMCIHHRYSGYKYKFDTDWDRPMYALLEKNKQDRIFRITKFLNDTNGRCYHWKSGADS